MGMTFKAKVLYSAYFIWIVAIIVGLVWFRFFWLANHSVKQYTSTAASFEAADITNDTQLKNLTGNPLVVHFIKKGCPCNKFSTPYIQSMLQENNSELEQILVYKNAARELEPAIERLYSRVPASPSVAIWNAKGQLEYFGPYSSGEYCGDGKDMVRHALDVLRRGDSLKWVNQEALSCFCSW